MKPETVILPEIPDAARALAVDTWGTVHGPFARIFDRTGLDDQDDAWGTPVCNEDGTLWGMPAWVEHADLEAALEAAGWVKGDARPNDDARGVRGTLTTWTR